MFVGRSSYVVPGKKKAIPLYSGMAIHYESSENYSATIWPFMMP